jgi:hypothetical protein
MTPNHAAPSGPDAGIPHRRLRVGSPVSLLAVIPGLLRFHPANSIVVVGAAPPRCEVQVTLRYDLPDPGVPRLAAAVAEQAVSVLSAQGIAMAFAVGYGPANAVSPVVGQLRERAHEAGIALTELLRVEGERYWSYLCTSSECCPPDGVPFDIRAHPAARVLAAADGPVLGSREELAATIAPADGELGRAMRRATHRVTGRIVKSASRLSRDGEPVSVTRLTAALGLVTVRDAIDRCRAGKPVGPEHAALLTVALRQLRVRDDAWARMLPEHAAAHLRLWRELTRLARPGYAAAPAALLAFVAWQAGDGALANVALDRALQDRPGYSMAVLLRRALDAGAPPSLARLPMSPEEVAAVYDAQDSDSDTEVADTGAEARPGGTAAAKRPATPRQEVPAAEARRERPHANRYTA